MSRLRTLIASTLALVGLTSRASAASIAKDAPQISVHPYAKPFTGHRYGTRISEGGNPPALWGCSSACRQMVRKNRYLRLRIERAQRRTKGGRKCTAKR